MEFFSRLSITAGRSIFLVDAGPEVDKETKRGELVTLLLAGSSVVGVFIGHK